MFPIIIIEKCMFLLICKILKSAIFYSVVHLYFVTYVIKTYYDADGTGDLDVIVSITYVISYLKTKNELF